MKLAFFDASSDYWALGHYAAAFLPSRGDHVTLDGEPFRVISVRHHGLTDYTLSTAVNVAPLRLAKNDRAIRNWEREELEIALRTQAFQRAA